MKKRNRERKMNGRNDFEIFVNGRVIPFPAKKIKNWKKKNKIIQK